MYPLAQELIGKFSSLTINQNINEAEIPKLSSEWTWRWSYPNCSIGAFPANAYYSPSISILRSLETSSPLSTFTKDDQCVQPEHLVSLQSYLHINVIDK